MPLKRRSNRKKCLEPNGGELSVEIAVEIDEVRLHQCRICGLVERRPYADVDGRRVFDAFGVDVAGGVHTIRRPRHAFSQHDVGRRKTNRAAPLIALHDLPTNLKRATQHLVCGFDVSRRRGRD